MWDLEGVGACVCAYLGASGCCELAVCLVSVAHALGVGAWNLLPW